MILVIEQDEMQRHLWAEIVRLHTSFPVYGAQNATEVIEHLGQEVKLVLIGYTDFIQYYPRIKHIEQRSGPGITEDNFILRHEVVSRLPALLGKICLVSSR